MAGKPKWAVTPRDQLPRLADEAGEARAIPPHEQVELQSSSYGLPDHDSLEERIARAEHDAGMPIGKLGHQSHCWLCRRHYEGTKNDRR